MDFNYKQRPASDEYRKNWERVFGSPKGAEPPATTVDGSAYLSPLDGDTGLPHHRPAKRPAILHTSGKRSVHSPLAYYPAEFLIDVMDSVEDAR